MGSRAHIQRLLRMACTRGSARVRKCCSKAKALQIPHIPRPGQEDALLRSARLSCYTGHCPGACQGRDLHPAAAAHGLHQGLCLSPEVLQRLHQLGQGEVAQVHIIHQRLGSRLVQGMQVSQEGLRLTGRHVYLPTYTWLMHSPMPMSGAMVLYVACVYHGDPGLTGRQDHLIRQRCT